MRFYHHIVLASLAANVQADYIISFPSSHIKHCVAAGEFCHFCYFVLYHSPAATSNTVWLLGNFVIFVILFSNRQGNPFTAKCDYSHV